ncbi:MAG: VWA domain-containing protein [Silvibacterium sp.]
MRRILPLFVLLLPALAAAQSGKPAPATIQVTSRIVYVDVTVRDSTGNIVHGLTQKVFRVFEDGKPQQIDYFSAHVYVPVTPSSKPASSLDFSNTNAPGQTGAVTILLFDLLNTSTPDQLVARKQMLKFLEDLPPGHRVSLFTLTDKLQMIQSFIGNPELLTAAAKMLKPVNLQHMPSREEVQQDQDIAREFDRESTGGRGRGGSAMDDNVQTQESDLGLRTYSTIAALAQLVQRMSGYQGHKNLYWISESFPIALNTTKGGWGQTLPVDAQRMTNLLADARIAVYPISVLGLDLGTSSVAVSGISGTVPDPKVFFAGRGTLKSAMNEIADQTGGEAIVDTNDLAGAMRRDLDDGSNYYTLAYQPQNKKWNKQFRNIRVELNQKGNSLTYRRGYFAYPDNAPAPNPAQQLNVALQPETPDSTTLALHSVVDLPDAQHSSVLVHSVLSAANLNLIPGSDGHHRGQIMVMLVAFKDDPGKAATQSDPPPQTSGTLSLDFDPAQYQSILKSGIAFTQQLPLPPGRYRLRLGVSDLTTQRLGTLDVPIAIPAQTAKN